MTPRHLLLIHQSFALPSEGGGTRHFELLRHFCRRGHRASVVSSAVSYLGSVHGAAAEADLAQAEGRLDVIRAYASRNLHTSFLWRLWAYVVFMASSFWRAMRVEAPSVVMGTTPPLFQAFAASVVAKLRRRPFLLEVRDLWPDFAIEMGVLKNPVLIFFGRLLERYLYWAADHLVVNSPAYRTYLLGRGIDPARISFIPNGVDVAMFESDEDPGALRDEFGWAGKRVFLYTGALGPANDIWTILDAAAAVAGTHPEVHFAFAGGGKDRARLEEAVATRGLANCEFLGVLSKADVCRRMRAAAGCLATLLDIPMFKTTYPNKVFDYMAAGRPTVLAIDGVIREVVEAAGGGVFVAPGDPAALAAAVTRLGADEAEAARMGAAAREYVRAHFDRAAQAEEFERLVVRLAAGPPES